MKMRRGTLKAERQPQAGVRKRTIGGLAEKFFQDPHEAESLLLEAVPELTSLAHYSVVRPSGGSPEYRTDATASDGLTYVRFNPPALWNAPYSLLRLYLTPVDDEKTTELMHHLGEELLAVTAGTMRYRFCWTRGGEQPRREYTAMLRPGSIIRINPMLPHHGSLPLGHGSSAEAWMVFRHPTELPTSISLDQRLIDKAKIEVPKKRIGESELMNDPGKYALTAWGLAEAINLRRLASGLTPGQVARICGIDRSHLARIEAGSTNVSLTALFSVAELLHINVVEHIRASLWSHHIDYFEKMETMSSAHHRRLSCLEAQHQHFLHPSLKTLSSGRMHSLRVESQFSSWIVLSGHPLVYITVRKGGVDLQTSPSSEALTEKRTEQLEPESVIHFHGRHTLQVECVAETRMLLIEYSSDCEAHSGSTR